MLQIVVSDLHFSRNVVQGSEHPRRIKARVRFTGMIGHVHRHQGLRPVIQLENRLARLEGSGREETVLLGVLGGNCQGSRHRGLKRLTTSWTA